MADRLNTQQRHHCMSRIRGKNTKPEILVRKGLHARGFRFRLHNRKLPGCPDIVLLKYGVAIMVNGCFWHGHKGCRYATRPKTNVDARLDELTEDILLAGENKSKQEVARQQNKSAARKMSEEMLRRQAQLGAEIDVLYPVPKRIKIASKEE